MRKMLFTLIFILAGTSAFARTFKIGDNTIDTYASVRALAMFNHTDKGEVEPRNRSQFVIRLQSNSRVGVRWTSGDLFFHNEWAMGGTDGTPGLTLRLLYGDYKFAGGEKGRIRAGQIPGLVNTHDYFDRKGAWDNGIQGFGSMVESRRAGINYEIGGFSISALSMRQDSSNVTGRYSSGFERVEFTEIMPRMEVSYTISDFMLGGTYVKSSVMANNVATGENDKRYGIDAGHIVFVARPRIGNNARLTASGFYAVNGGLYGMVSMISGYNDSEAVNRNALALPQLKAETTTGEMDNTKTFGGGVALTVGNFGVGFGYQSTGNDAWEDNVNGMGVYANYRYRLSSNFRITPEIGYVHTGNRGNVAKGADVLKGTQGLQIGMQLRFDI